MKVGIPSAYSNASTLLVFCGLANGASSAFWFFLLISWCVGALWIVPGLVSLGVLFIASKMSSGQKQHNAKAAAIAGILCGVVSTNPVGLALGLLAMLKIDDAEVQQWLNAEQSVQQAPHHASSGPSKDRPSPEEKASAEDALATLKKGLERGEIDQAEFTRLKRDILKRI